MCDHLTSACCINPAPRPPSAAHACSCPLCYVRVCPLPPPPLPAPGASPSVFYPKRVKHLLCQGVANTYETVGGITQGAELHKAYQLPVSPTVPVDVQYLDTVSPVVPVREGGGRRRG